MVPYAKGSPLDPASYDPAGGSNLVTKMGIDATRKSNYPDEIKVPGFESDRHGRLHPGLPEFVGGRHHCMRPRSVSTIGAVTGASTGSSAGSSPNGIVRRLTSQ